jgi:hypothetical protein
VEFNLINRKLINANHGPSTMLEIEFIKTPSRRGQTRWGEREAKYYNMATITMEGGTWYLHNTRGE